MEMRRKCKVRTTIYPLYTISEYQAEYGEVVDKSKSFGGLKHNPQSRREYLYDFEVYLFGTVSLRVDLLYSNFVSSLVHFWQPEIRIVSDCSVLIPKFCLEHPYEQASAVCVGNVAIMNCCWNSSFEY